jgi:hypothetical protein
VKHWKSEEPPKIIDGYQLKDTFNVDETGLLYNLQPSKTLTYKGDSCHGGTISKQRVTILVRCNADDTDKLPPLVTGKYNKPHCFRSVKKNSPPNTQQISILGSLQSNLRTFLCNWITRWGQKTEKSCSPLINVLHTEEIPLF